MARLASAVLALIALLPVASARAGDLFTGVQVDDEARYFAYLGIQEELPWKAPALQPYVQLFSAAQSYEYQAGGQTVEAEVQFVTPSLGARRSFGDSGWSVAALVGPKLQWKREERPLAASTHDFEAGVVVQLEPMYWQETHSLQGVFSYSSLDDFFFARARAKVRVLRPETRCCAVFAGADVSGMGNEDYEAVQAGPLVEVPLGPFSVLARGGYQRDSSRGHLAYGGLELYAPF